MGVLEASVAKLTDYAKRGAFRRSGRDFVVIAAMPKSASLHFKRLYQAVLPDHRVATPKLDTGEGHNFLSKEKADRSVPRTGGYTLYGHFPFSRYNDRIASRYTSAKTAIITIRNLSDIVVSYKEHIDHNGAGPLDALISGAPEGNPRWNQMADAEKYSYLILFVLPWYVRFVSGWCLAAQGNWNVRFSFFEEHVTAPGPAVIDIVRSLGLTSASPQELEAFVPPAEEKTNFNFGIAGRGRKLLTSHQHDAIRELLEASLGDTESLLAQYLLRGYEAIGRPPGEIVAIRLQDDTGNAGPLFLPLTEALSRVPSASSAQPAP